MPVAGLQDSPIIGKKLGGSLSEAYLLGGKFPNGLHPVLISTPMLENGLLMTSIRCG